MFSPEEQETVIAAIRDAEKRTSGEIRVHVEPNCKSDPFVRAREVFEQLGMAATAQKNGVLFYIAHEDKKFAILGDSGIHEKVKDVFWQEERDILMDHFSRKAFAEGLAVAIAKVGEKLQQHFPYQSDDSDELSNDISFGGDKDA
jgi:uncharacterized membrane protein